ncbi:MAG: hypothetical protein AAF039_18430 [Bacteroidota bacterium]
MRRINSASVTFFAFLFIFLSACSDDDSSESMVLSRPTLATVLESREIERGNVIACAASNENPEVVSVFLYPRPGVGNIRYFETASAEVNANDFNNYSEVLLPLLDVFNGYLLKYEVDPEVEKWVVVTFEEDGKVHLSNPIRLKHISKPTEYLPENVSVDNTSSMPNFSWIDGRFDDSVIYFHVVSDESDALLSGTYTVERMFQYYKLDNVVLNITREQPPELETDQPYGFSLLAVSEDNWVNLFAEVDFELE